MCKLELYVICLHKVEHNIEAGGGGISKVIDSNNLKSVIA